MEHAELVIKVNETGPGEGVTLDGLTHGIGGLEFVGEAEHVQTTIAVLVVDGDDVVPSWLALLSAASQLVGNVGFSIILTVF